MPIVVAIRSRSQPRFDPVVDDHDVEQQWRNGLGRPDSLCGRRFDPERTFFTNQDIFHISARSGSMPIVVDSPLV